MVDALSPCMMRTGILLIQLVMLIIISTILTGPPPPGTPITWPHQQQVKMAKTMTVAHSGTVCPEWGCQPLDTLISLDNGVLPSREIIPGYGNLGVYVRLRAGRIISSHTTHCIYYKSDAGHYLAFELIPLLEPDPEKIIAGLTPSIAEREWLTSHWDTIMETHV
jgi:hypothetical protein